MGDVNVSITIRSQEAEAGAVRARRALREVKNEAKNTQNETLKLNQTLSDLGRAIRLVDGPLGGVASRFQTLSGIAAISSKSMIAFTLASAATVFALSKIVGIARETERNLLRVDTALIATGRSAEITVGQVEQLAIKFGELTLSNKDAGLKAIAAISTFKDVATKDFESIITSAQGLSSVFGGDLVNNAQKIARALESPGEAATVLDRQLGKLTKGQVQYLRNLEETGRKAEAQALIMGRLSAFTALAAAEAGGLAGKQDTLGERTNQAAVAADRLLGITQAYGFVVDGLTGFITSLNTELAELNAKNGDAEVSFEALATVLDSRVIASLATLVVGARTVYQTLALFGQSAGFFDDYATLSEKFEDSWRTATKNVGADTQAYFDDLRSQQAKASEDALAARKKASDAFSSIPVIPEAADPKLLEKAAKLTEKQKDILDLARSRVAQEDRLGRALSVSLGYHEEIKAQIEVEDTLRKEGKDLTEAQRQELENLLRVESARARVNDQIVDNLEAQRKEAEKLYDSISEDLASVIEDGLTGGAKSGFEAILTYAETTFYQRLAKIFATSVLDGLVIPATQGLGEALGSISGASGAKAGFASAGSGSTFGNLGSISNLVSGGSSLFNSVLPSGVGTVVDDIGYSLFGVGQQVAGPFTGAAPFTEGVSGGLAGSFSVANIGAGFAGSLAAGALFGDGIGTSVGSSVGGLGAGVGAAALGLGPIGAASLIFGGALAGGGIGSLFGGAKPSSKLQSATIDPATGQILERGGLTGDKFSQDNFDAVTALSGAVAELSRTIGGDTSSIGVAVSDRYGFEFALGGTEKAFTGEATPELRRSFDTANEFFKGLVNELVTTFPENASERLTSALGNIDFGKTEEDLQRALEDVAFASNFEKIFEEPVVESLSQVERQIVDLNTTFDDFSARGKRLKLAQEDLTRLEDRRVELANEYIDAFIKEQQVVTAAESAVSSLNTAYDSLVKATTEARLGTEKLAEVQAARARDLGKLAGAFNTAVTNELLDVLSPRLSALSQEGERYKAQLKDAETLGGDLRRVELLHKLNLLKIEQEYGVLVDRNGEKVLQTSGDVSKLVDGYSSLAENLEDALFNLRLGSTSTLSPQQKLTEAESRFRDLADKALNGDLDAANELSSVGSEFLELSRRYNSISDEFVQDFSLVESTLEETKAFALTELEVQRGILSTLTGGFDDLLAELNSLGELLTFDGGLDDSASAGKNAAGVSLSSTSGAFGLTVGQVESTARSLLGGYTGTTGSGELNQLLSERGLTGAFEQALKSMAGFATGGINPVGEPYIVGERGPEIRMSGTAGRITPLVMDMEASRQIADSNALAASQLMATERGFNILVDQVSELVRAQYQAANAARSNNSRRVAK
jgi:hypothetical protein